MLSKLVNRMAAQEGVTEQLKGDNQIEWVGKIIICQRDTEKTLQTQHFCDKIKQKRFKYRNNGG